MARARTGGADAGPMVPLDGQEARLQPILVEVKADGYTVHPSKQRFPPIELPEGAGKLTRASATPDLQEFLEKADSRRQREYLLFLIHPNGAAAFDGVRAYLRRHHSELHGLGALRAELDCFPREGRTGALIMGMDRGQRIEFNFDSLTDCITNLAGSLILVTLIIFGLTKPKESGASTARIREA